MSKEELKKKIETIILKTAVDCYDYVPEYLAKEMADDLIAAGIGDVKEAEYQVKILKRALRMTVSKIEYLQFQISTRQECPISIPDIEEIDCEPYVRRAEDELLFEEEKLKGGER